MEILEQTKEDLEKGLLNILPGYIITLNRLILVTNPKELRYHTLLHNKITAEELLKNIKS
jgi:hypothetical protein